MELLLGVIVLGAIVGGGVLWQKHVADPDPSPWQALAEAAGVTDVRRMNIFSSDVAGRLGGLEVVIGSYSSARYQRSTRLRVQGLSHFVFFKREGLASRIEKALAGGEIEIGDEAFDRAVFLQGEWRLLRAVLDAETRRLLLAAFSCGPGPEGPPDRFRLSIAGGAMEAGFFDTLGFDPLPRVETVRALLDLARRLQEPRDVVARLAANAAQDPLPAVRRNALRALEHSAAEATATRAAMERAAREDADGSVRLQAALWLGAAGTTTLEALAVDGTVEDAVSARAIAELGERMDPDLALRVLDRSMAEERTLTSSAAALAAGRGGEKQVAPLVAALEQASGAVAVAVARGLGRTGSARAEAALLAALGREGEDVPAAIAAALGQVGTAASMLPLRELAHARRGLASDAALGALALIRERLGAIDPGRLSLAVGADGQLALAEDMHGRVALPDPKEPP